MAFVSIESAGETRIALEGGRYLAIKRTDHPVDPDRPWRLRAEGGNDHIVTIGFFETRLKAFEFVEKRWGGQ